MERHRGTRKRHEESLMAARHYALLTATLLLGQWGCSLQATATGGGITEASVLPPATVVRDDADATVSTVKPPRDFWTTFQAGLTLADKQSTPELADEIAWLRSHPRYLHHSLLRGTDYIPFLVEEANRHGLPVDVVLIPALESSFNAATPGGGTGPAGLWQLTGPTAKTLGLSHNAWYDGRRDILDSTDAAMRYLAKLGKLFDGNWLLAIAAYNAGPGRVQAVFRPPYDRVTLASIHRSGLPAHTRAYIERLAAVSWFIKNSVDRSSFPVVASSSNLDVVPFTRSLPLSRIINEAQLSASDVLPFNTGLLKGVTHPQAPRRLLVRKDVAWKLAAVDWDTVGSQTPVRFASSNRYTVARGDTLSAIARRFGTSVQALQSLNQLSGSRLSVGQVLAVPDVRESRVGREGSKGL